MFDLKVTIVLCVDNLVADASWRLRALLRARRFHSVPDMIHLYKSKVLSFIEYRTSALYHSCTSHLIRLDAVQGRLLRVLGISKHDVLLEHNLAPLAARRDLAMLGSSTELC